MFAEHQRLYNRSQRTAESQVRVLGHHFAGRTFSTIRRDDVRAMVAARLEQGASKGTVNRNLSALSKMSRLAIDEWGAHPGPNPVRGIQRFREAPGRTRFLTEPEAQRLIDAAADHLKPLLYAALLTGGRLSELLSLRWSDLDLDTGVLYFRRETTKSGRERMVPMAEGLVEALRQMKPGRPGDRVFVFRGRGYRSVRTSFARARRIAGLGPDVTFHVLRHSFASGYVQRGGDLYRLQRYLGHSTIELTQRYAHLSPQYLRDGVRYFGPPKGDSE